MERFATNKNGNIASGTEVLANNITFLQQAKADAISNLFGDLFVEGILNTGNENTTFKLTGNADGTFNVSVGTAYIKDVMVTPSIYERIAIIDDTEEYDATNPQQTTFDGVDQYVATPKSSGCKNIPIPNAQTLYYVDLRYLSVCDNGNTGDGLGLTNYSLAKKDSPSDTVRRKRFYKWVDGYEIVLAETTADIKGVCLGTVTKDNNNEVTIADTNRTGNLLIESRVFMEYFNWQDGTGIVVEQEDDKISVNINTDNVTTEINDDNQLRITTDALYPYTKFTANSGNKDLNNEPYILITDSYGVDLFFGAIEETPLVVSPAYNDKYTILPTTTISKIANASQTIYNYYNETANGTYTICINNTDKDLNNILLENPKLEIMKEVIISKTSPIMYKGNIWVDISVEPYKAKWFNGGSWLEYHGVPLGEIDISSNIVQTVRNFDFTSLIKDIIKINQLNFYNYNASAEINNTKVILDNNGYMFFDNIKGISFNTQGTFDIANDSINLNFSTVTIKNNPVPRMPNYASKIENFVSSSPNSNDDGSDSHTNTATVDGWLQLKRYIGNSSGDDAWFKINNNNIFMLASSNATQLSGFYPIKKGDVIEVRRGFSADFYPYI